MSDELIKESHKSLDKEYDSRTCLNDIPTRLETNSKNKAGYLKQYNSWEADYSD